MYKTKLDYVSGKSLLPADSFNVSPSQFHRFFSETHKWYRTEVLGEQGFKGSTASVLGTITHFIAEQFTKYNNVDKVEIYKYIYNHADIDKKLKDIFDSLLTNMVESTSEAIEEDVVLFLLDKARTDEYDIKVILTQYKEMGNALITFIINGNAPTVAEENISTVIRDNYYVGGSCDALRVYGDKDNPNHTATVVDYKTVTALKPPTKIPYKYKLQLLCYAFIYRKLGYNVNTVSIVWITKPRKGELSEKTGKLLPDVDSQVASVNETINNEDFDFIESLLTLTADSVELSKTSPELTYIIFKDMRLKLDVTDKVKIKLKVK